MSAITGVEMAERRSTTGHGVDRECHHHEEMKMPFVTTARQVNKQGGKDHDGGCNAMTSNHRPGQWHSF